MSELDRVILAMIKQGATNTDIADHTHYSLASVKVRIRRLMRYLDAKNRTELAAKTSRLSDIGGERSTDGLTDAEIVLLLQFPNLPPEKRAIIAEVVLALSKALSKDRLSSDSRTLAT